MTRTTTQATEATQAAILTILSTGEQLRQYEIARELGIHEHNDWSTRAVLEAMIRSELIEMERYNSINKDGSLSKLTYRHFRLTYKGRQATRTKTPGMRRRDILRNWVRALGF